jgi:hypothetical protein
MPSEKGRIYVEHLMDALLRGKTSERFAAYQLGLQNGVYSANEVREFENQNPFDGGDVHLQMANMVPYGTEPAAPEEPQSEPVAAPRAMVREIKRTTEGGYVLTEREVANG